MMSVSGVASGSSYPVETSALAQVENLSLLSDDLLKYILGFLPKENFLNVAGTCRRFQKIILSEKSCQKQLVAFCIGQIQIAIPHLSGAASQSHSLLQLARIQVRMHEFGQARVSLDQAEAFFDNGVEIEGDLATVITFVNFAKARRRARDAERAEALMEDALAMADSIYDPEERTGAFLACIVSQNFSKLALMRSIQAANAMNVSTERLQALDNIIKVLVRLGETVKAEKVFKKMIGNILRSDDCEIRLRHFTIISQALASLGKDQLTIRNLLHRAWIEACKVQGIFKRTQAFFMLGQACIKTKQVEMAKNMLQSSSCLAEEIEDKDQKTRMQGVIAEAQATICDVEGLQATIARTQDKSEQQIEIAVFVEAQVKVGKFAGAEKSISKILNAYHRAKAWLVLMQDQIKKRLDFSRTRECIYEEIKRIEGVSPQEFLTLVLDFAGLENTAGEKDAALFLLYLAQLNAHKIQNPQQKAEALLTVTRALVEFDS